MSLNGRSILHASYSSEFLSTAYNKFIFELPVRLGTIGTGSQNRNTITICGYFSSDSMAIDINTINIGSMPT